MLQIAVLAAAVLWTVRADRLPLNADRQVYELEVPVPVVDVAEARDLFAAGNHLFVDTREGERQETVLGAFRIRADRFNDDLYDLVELVYPEDPIVLFGDGDLNGPVHVAELLLSRGFEDLVILRGSVTAWRKQGGEVSRPDPEAES